MASADELRRLLSSLVGEPLWRPQAGPSTGSILGIEIGAMRKLDVPLSNPRLSRVHQEHEGTVSLLVHCAWRIETPDGVLCTSDSPNEDGQEMQDALAEIADQTIVDINVAQPSFDVRFELGNRSVLHLFCDIAHDEHGAYNYYVFSADTVFTVGPKSSVSSEAREPLEVNPVPRRTLKIVPPSPEPREDGG